MQIYDNSWDFITKTHEIFSEIINEKADAKLSDSGEVTKLEKKIKLKKADIIFNYFVYIEKMMENTTPDNLLSITSLIHKELWNLWQSLTKFQTTIRNIQNVYKLNSCFNRVDTKIKQIKDQILKTFKGILKKNMDYLKPRKDCEIDIFNNDGQSSLNKIEQIQVLYEKIPLSFPHSFNNLPHIWFQLNSIKNSTYSYDKNKIKSLKQIGKEIIEELDILEKLFYKATTTTKGSVFYFNDVVKSDKLKLNPILKDNAALSEFFYYLFNTSIIIEKKSKQSGGIKKSLQNYISRVLIKVVREIFNQKGLNSQVINNPNRDLQISVSTHLRDLKEKLISEANGNLSKAAENFQKEEAHFLSIIEEIEGWMKIFIEPYISPYESILRQYLSSFKSCKEEVIREIEDFKLYADSVKEASDRNKLEDIIREEIKKTKYIINTYQNDTLQITQKDIPQIEQLNTLIANYKEKIEEIQNRVLEIFKKYENQKDVNIHSVYKMWEKEYSTLINQSGFYIAKVVEHLNEQFKGIIKKEKNLFKDSTLIDFNLSISTSMIKSEIERSDKGKNSSQILKPEKLNESQLKEVISEYKSRIEKLDLEKKKLINQKKEYQEVLRKLLKDTHHVESKQCAICHKVVDVGEEQYVSCEFCSALYHYLCAAVWIKNYNSCPVCNNSYTQPHNELFNPEESR